MEPCNNCPFSPKSLPYVNPDVFQNMLNATYPTEVIRKLGIPNGKKLGLKLPCEHPDEPKKCHGNFRCHKDNDKPCNGYLLTLMKSSIMNGFELPLHIKKLIKEDQSSFKSFEEAAKHHEKDIDSNIELEYDNALIPMEKNK